MISDLVHLTRNIRISPSLVPIINGHDADEVTVLTIARESEHSGVKISNPREFLSFYELSRIVGALNSASRIGNHGSEERYKAFMNLLEYPLVINGRVKPAENLNKTQSLDGMTTPSDPSNGVYNEQVSQKPRLERRKTKFSGPHEWKRDYGEAEKVLAPRREEKEKNPDPALIRANLELRTIRSLDDVNPDSDGHPIIRGRGHYHPKSIPTQAKYGDQYLPRTPFIEPKDIGGILRYFGFLGHQEKTNLLKSLQAKDYRDANVIFAANHLAKFYGLNGNYEDTPKKVKQVFKNIVKSVHKRGMPATDLAIQAFGIEKLAMIEGYTPIRIGRKQCLVPERYESQIRRHLEYLVRQRNGRSKVGRPEHVMYLGLQMQDVNGIRVYIIPPKN